MTKYCYIFIERNMGNDYAHAYPPSQIFSWDYWRVVRQIKPWAERFQRQSEEELRQTLSTEDLEKRLAEGLAFSDAVAGHLVFTLKIQPDLQCPDPRAKGRGAYFLMYMIMPDNLEIISKRFGDFRQRCQDAALSTMQPGANPALRIEIPENLFVD